MTTNTAVVAESYKRTNLQQQKPAAAVCQRTKPNNGTETNKSTIQLQWWANPNRDWDLNRDLNTFREWFDSLHIWISSQRLGFDSIGIICDSIWATRSDGRIIAGCYSSVIFSV